MSPNAVHEAIIYGLEICNILEANNVGVFTESQLAVNQAKGEFEVNEKRIG